MNVQSLLHPQGQDFRFYEEMFREDQLNKQLLSQAIEIIISTESLLEKIARLSYSHELGFDKIIIWRDLETGCVLRLHTWWPNASPHMSDEINIHNHGRHFVSRLIQGNFQQQTWQVTTSGEPFFKYQYSFDDRTLQSVVTDCGLAHLSKVSDNVLQEGQWYKIQTETLHRVIPLPHVLTCTTVIQSPLVSRLSDVYVKSRTEILDSGTKLPMQREELRGKLKLLYDALLTR